MRNFLTPEEVQLLQTAHRQCKERRKADRIKTILGLNMGYGYEELATLLMLDDSTLRSYYAEYQEGGIEKLLEDN